MPRGTSPWRVNDVVAYDRMRSAAVTAFARLQAAARRRGGEAETAQGKLAGLRRGVLTVDPYDRAAVAALAARIDYLLRELEDRAS